VILCDRWGTSVGDFKRALNDKNPASVAKQLTPEEFAAWHQAQSGEKK
jgi:hypothetical protein